MTTEALGRSATAACNGATQTFAVPFQFGEDGLRVYLLDAADDDNEDGELLTEGTDYTVSGDGASATASITTATAYPSGKYLRRWRETPRAQTQNYTAGPFPADPSNVALDRLAMVDEELDDDIARLSGRAVQVAAGDAQMVLPAAADRADRYLKFNSDGEPVMATGTVDAPDLNSVPVLTNFGEVDTTAAAHATATAALAAAGRGGTVYIDAEADTGATPPNNPGVDLIGQHPLYYDAGDGRGGVPINKIGRNPFLLRWGLERLSKPFLNKVRSGSACKVIIIGDSNAASWWGPILANLLAGLPGVTVVNNAVGSSTLDDWYNDTGTVNGTGKDFASTMAADPDLIIDCYAGDTNGPYFGGTAADFDTLQAAVYAAIRAHANGGKTAMGLLAVTGSPMRDGGAMSIEGGAKRDELHSARVRASTLRNCNATGIKAAFFDLNAMLCDAELADLDANVHTQNSMADMAAHALFEWLIPAVYRGGASAYIGTKAAAALPATYPDNLTAFRMSDGAFDGFGFHLRPSFGATAHGLQFNWRYNAAGQVALRHAYSGSTWSGWQYVGQTAVEAATAAAGFTNPATSSGLNTRRDGGMTSLRGMLTMDTPGTIAAGTTIATILAAYRSDKQVTGVVLTCRDGAGGASGAYEHIFATIETDGTIVTRSAAALTVTGIHMNAAFRFA